MLVIVVYSIRMVIATWIILLYQYAVLYTYTRSKASRNRLLLF